MIREKLGCHTSLGVSNVSFGLPMRDAVNGTFFALALGNGLSAAIMNPYSADMMKTYYTYRALAGLDPSCAQYIDYATRVATQAPTVTASAVAPTPTVAPSPDDGASPLMRAIIKGLRDQAATLTDQLLSTAAPMDVVQNDVIPALDTVGQGFEKGTVYLPQLLMSAEAAQAAFGRVKTAMTAEKSDADEGKMTIVLATVKGDIHDIGKNIVKLLLENYGFRVIDLGRDVAPATVLDAVLQAHAPLAALSALMTTTVPAMADTIALIHEKAPFCRVIVGGAVLNPEYAASIHADAYGKDAMSSVRYAEQVYQEINTEE
jgi:5-methyltetrahydrofolate--homocysteine methyltransferase